MTKRRLALGAAVAVAFAPCVDAVAGPTYVVNSLVDAPAGGNPSDHVCETAPGNGVCTLRAAVEEANHTTGGGSTIRIPRGTYYLTIAPSGQPQDVRTGEIDILNEATLEGEGPSATIVDGSGVAGVFHTRFAIGTGRVVVRGMTVQHSGGRSPGILNSGTALIENVALLENAGSAGGGVYNQSNLVMRHCLVMDNTADDRGGGVYNNGGPARIEDSAIIGNVAGG